MTPPPPKWATVHKSNDSLKSSREPSTANSEELLRLKSVRYWSFRLRQAQEQTWKDVCDPAMEKFDDFSSLTMTMTEVNETAKALTKAKFSMVPSTIYPPELLPCLVVNPPPTCKLDRQAMMQSLYSYHRHRNHRNHHHRHRHTPASPQAMTIGLPRLMPTLQQTLALVWRQILQQEPNKNIQKYAKKKLGKNKRTQSLQQWIVWWASQTEHFDRLVVLLEDPGGFAQTRVRQEFYRALAEWRSEHGLPVSLMVMGTHEQVQDLCPLGVRIQLFSSLPQNENATWICQFLEHLVLTNDGGEFMSPPPPLWWNSTVWELIQDYQHRHGSRTKFVQDMNQSISHFFASTKGSFVWDLHHHNTDFVAWFCTYETAKTYLSNSDYGWEKYQAIQQCRHMQRRIHYLWKGMVLGLPLFLTHGAAAGSENYEKKKSTLSSSTKETLSTLAKLHAWAQEVFLETTTTDDATDTQKDQLQRFLDPNQQIKDLDTTITIDDTTTKKIKTIIQELVILVAAQQQQQQQQQQHDTSAQFPKPPDAETIKEGLADMIKTLFQLLGEQIDLWIDQWIDLCPLYLVGDHKESEFLKEVHLRREIVDDLPQPAQTMYQLLQGRLSIGREEWLHDFGGSVDDFTMGVWFLIVTGLLQRKRARGGRLVYEKVPVVWTYKS